MVVEEVVDEDEVTSDDEEEGREEMDTVADVVDD